MNISFLEKSRSILLDILFRQGYLPPEELNDIENLEELEYVLSKENGDTCFVCWLPTSCGTGDIRRITSIMEESDISVANIVTLCEVPFTGDKGSRKGVTPDAQKTINTLLKKGITIWVWKLEETLIDISKHCYVPEHFICSEKEASEVIKKYGKKSKLPSIRRNDVMIRFIGASKGQIIRIEEDSFCLHGEKTIRYVSVVS